MTIDTDRHAQDTDIAVFMEHKMMLREHKELISNVNLLIKTITPTFETIEEMLAQHLYRASVSVVKMSEQYKFDPQTYLCKLPSKESQATSPYMNLYISSVNEFLTQLSDVLTDVEETVQASSHEIQPYDGEIELDQAYTSIVN